MKARLSEDLASNYVTIEKFRVRELIELLCAVEDFNKLLELTPALTGWIVAGMGKNQDYSHAFWVKKRNPQWMRVLQRFFKN